VPNIPSERHARLGGNLCGDLHQAVPGPGGVVGDLHLGLLPHGGVGEEDQAVDADVDPDQLVVDPARLDGALDELGRVNPAQVEQRAAVAVLGDVGHIHLDDVRSRPAGGLRGQLLPVAGELARLGLDLHIGVGLEVRVDRSLRVRVPGRVAPPGQGHGRGTRLAPAATTAAAAIGGTRGEAASGGSRRQPSGPEKKLPTVDGHSPFPFAVDVKAFSEDYGEPSHSVNAPTKPETTLQTGSRLKVVLRSS
jgi:hypothetical protein